MILGILLQKNIDMAACLHFTYSMRLHRGLHHFASMPGSFFPFHVQSLGKDVIHFVAMKMWRCSYMPAFF